ncbi:glycoprotein Xg isoform X5 [Sagmatias obliquidens]|uniref:glycoprotein Xg isoform X5 n=1 Tax=Sagmatias obliquidens TaxID=3371155 RepID=UPI000F44121D|nr:glycoprotein Xg isoform X5 [Lagenorhynchus obliquidens]
MEPWWGLFCLTFLCSVMHVRGQGDFDLADALDDPEPTKKPSSGLLESKYGRYQVSLRVWRHWSLRALLVGIDNGAASAENSLAAAQKATYRISL